MSFMVTWPKRGVAVITDHGRDESQSSCLVRLPNPCYEGAWSPTGVYSLVKIGASARLAPEPAIAR